MNAIYGREVRALAQQEMAPELLQRRLASLPYYIHRAAHALLAAEQHSPLSLDYQNASWQGRSYRQAPKAPAPATTARWLQRHAKLALPVLVRVTAQQVTRIRLDTIDEIRATEVHLNAWGWFTREGTSSESPTITLERPSRPLLTVALTGQCWRPSGPTLPQPLTLRELFISAVVHWQQPAQIRALPF